MHEGYAGQASGRLKRSQTEGIDRGAQHVPPEHARSGQLCGYSFDDTTRHSIMNLPLYFACFVAIAILATSVRAWLNRKDLQDLASGKPYQRKHFISSITDTSSEISLTNCKPALIDYFHRKRFRVLATPNALWAVSPPYSDLSVLVSIETRNALTISIYDRYLQPIMIGWMKRRFQKYMNRISNDIKQIVEHVPPGGRGEAPRP